MDQQANDCPCKRQRVSEGDDTDQETGMVVNAAIGQEEITDKTEGDFQQHEEGNASVGENEEKTFQSCKAALDNSVTGAAGDSVNKYDLSNTGTCTVTVKEKLSELLSIPGSSGDENQSVKGGRFKVNQSTENSGCEQIDENQSENAGAGPWFHCKEVEPDTMYCASNSAENELKGSQDSGNCEYVQNVQAIAESSYIRMRERNMSQNEFRLPDFLESPKLKRRLHRTSTNIAKQKIEFSCNSQSKSASSELKNIGHYVNQSSYSDPIHSGADMSDDSAECDRNKHKCSAESSTCSEPLANVQTACKDNECDEKCVSEQNKSVPKEADQQYFLPDLGMETCGSGTKSNRNCQNQGNSNIRVFHDSLDDSGFIEMFSNSVMGYMLCGNGNGGSYRNSGRTGTWKDFGNSDKNSNVTRDKDRTRNTNEETRINVSSYRASSKDDGHKVNATGRQLDDSNETCRFGELGNILKDIGQPEEMCKTLANKLVNSKMSTDYSGLGLGTSGSSSTLSQSQNVSVNENKNQDTNAEQMACNSKGDKPKTTSTALRHISVTREVSEAAVAEEIAVGTERPKNRSRALPQLGVKVSDGNTRRELDTKFKPDSAMINGRFKLDFEQTREIVSQNNINSLPITILVHIFRNLTVFELLRRASGVCKYWYNQCRDPDIWRNICLVNQHRLTDVDLEWLLFFSDYRVRNVNLTDCRFVTNKGIRYLVLNCPQIEVLRVMRCFDLTDVAFEGLYSLYLCSNLRALYMDGCCRITDNTVQEVSDACPELRTLHLNQCTRISDSGIINVAKMCPHLTDLQLDHCSQVTDEGISEIVMGCPNLLYLNLMCCGITDTGVKYLAKLTKLTNLDLSNIPRLTSDSIVYLSKFCKNLQCINVSLNTVMDDSCIAQLAMNLPMLKRLYCVSCSISDKGLEDIAKYRPTLEALDVGWCQEVTDNGVRVISLACKHLDYFGLIRCDRVTIETIEELVLKYPRINYSTFILESRRLLERARNEGYQFSLPSH